MSFGLSPTRASLTAPPTIIGLNPLSFRNSNTCVTVSNISLLTSIITCCTGNLSMLIGVLIDTLSLI